MRGVRAAVSDDASFSERHILICDASESRQRLLRHASRGRPLPATRGADASNPVLAARLVAPEVCQTAKQRPPKQRKGEAERRKAHTRGRSAQSQRRRWAGSRRAPLLADALAFRRSTAALAKVFRPWLSPVPRFMAAPTDVLRPPPGQRAPRRPASGPAGRVSEPPANGVTNPIPGTAPARINRPSPVDVP